MVETSRGFRDLCGLIIPDLPHIVSFANSVNFARGIFRQHYRIYYGEQFVYAELHLCFSEWIICKIWKLDEHIVEKGLDSSFTVFEDALHYFSAVDSHCDLVITRNKKDFRKSLFPVMTAREYLHSIKPKQEDLTDQKVRYESIKTNKTKALFCVLGYVLPFRRLENKPDRVTPQPLSVLFFPQFP